MSFNRVCLSYDSPDTIACGTKGLCRFVDSQEDGHGRTGQVKKASFYERSVTVNEYKLNRGSLIDFINANSNANLEKGNCIFGGATDEKIVEELDKIKKIWRKKSAPSIDVVKNNSDRHDYDVSDINKNYNW